MTPMSGALDLLAVGEGAEERGTDSSAILGGGAARLAAHAAALRARIALVAKVGEDDAGRRVRDALERLKVDLRWLRSGPAMRTTVWHEPDGQAQRRRVERGADLALRLDELPPPSVPAALTVVSGYSLSVEPARSAALGALAGARARGARAALLIEADLLWWTNARMMRRVLEPALASVDSVALQTPDARVLFGAGSGRDARRPAGATNPARCACVGDSWRRWLVAAFLCALLLPSAASLPARPRPAMSVSFVVEPAAVEVASPSPAPTDVAGFATRQ